MDENTFSPEQFGRLMRFFNGQREKLLCTVSREGEPDAALMGTPTLEANGEITFTISEAASISLRNMRVNRRILLLAYQSGDRARDYIGVRIAAQVDDISLSGPSFLAAHASISEKHGPAKAATLYAVIRSSIINVRALVDRGQHWAEALPID